MKRTYRVKGIRPATDAEIATKTRLDELAERQLSSVRDTAQNWRNNVGFGAIASAVVGLLQTPDIVKSASPQQVADGAWLLGIAVVVTAASFACALRASFGWPRWTTITSADALRQWEDREVGATIFYLRWSMIVAVPGFLALCAGYAVMIFDIPLPIHFPGWQ